MTSSAALVERTFLRSLTFAVSAAALILAQAEESSGPSSLTPFFAVISYFVVDRKSVFGLPVLAANILGLVAFGFVIVEFWRGDLVGKLLAGAHLLVYMTWIVLFLRKGIRQFWWLLGLCVLQLAVASVLTNDPQFGTCLVGMLLVFVWVLALFTLYRAQRRVSQQSEMVEDSLNVAELSATTGVTIRNGLQVDSNERWIGWRFRGIVAFAWLASIVVGVFAFVVFPRVHIDRSGIGVTQSRGLTHRTGYTGSVELGEIGEILESDGRVFQFEIERVTTGEPVTPDTFAREMKMDEILFRGQVLAQYEDGRWDATRFGEYADRNWRKWMPRRGRPKDADADYRIRITQDPPMGDTAFAPAPFANAAPVDDSDKNSMRQQPWRHTLQHFFKEQSREASPLTYDVWCYVPEAKGAIHRKRYINFIPSIFGFSGENQRQRDDTNEILPASVNRQEYRFTRDWFITPHLAETLPQLTGIAQEVCSTNGSLVDVPERCDRVLQYLSSPDNFEYSLKADIVDSSIDPIEDFLVNRRIGHCEYFASACALMLQAVDVPARVVNGFKGSETNSVSGRAEVKQFHGHTWAEAWIDGNWITLDPSPIAGRAEAVTRQKGRMSWLADWRLVMADGWYRLLGFMSPERQEAMVAPLLKKIQAELEQIRRDGIWQSLKSFVVDFVRNPDQWFSLRGWIVTFVVLLLPALVMRKNLFGHLARLLQSAWKWLQRGGRQQRSVVRFYENFRSLCNAHGMLLPPHHTAQENADAAVANFAGFLTHPDDRSIPARIASAFNRVRFGDEVMSEDAVEAVRKDVQRFSELISAN